MQSPDPSTAGRVSVDKLGQEGECQGFGLARSADPNEFIKELLHVPVPCLADEGKSAFYAHGRKVLVDLTGSLEERETEGDVERVRGHDCGLAEDEQPYFCRQTREVVCRGMGIPRHQDAERVWVSAVACHHAFTIK